MNPLIRTFITESGIELTKATGHITAIGRDVQERRLNKFAELIITECAKITGQSENEVLNHFGLNKETN